MVGGVTHCPGTFSPPPPIMYSTYPDMSYLQEKKCKYWRRQQFSVEEKVSVPGLRRQSNCRQENKTVQVTRQEYQ